MENRNYGGYIWGDGGEKIRIYPSEPGEAKTIAEIEQARLNGCAIYVKIDGTITPNAAGYYPTPETGEDAEGETIEHPILIKEGERAEDLTAEEIDRRYNEIVIGHGWTEEGDFQWIEENKWSAFAIWRGVKIQFYAIIADIFPSQWDKKIEEEISYTREKFYVSTAGLYVNECQWEKIAAKARVWLRARLEQEEREEEEREREMEKRLDEKYGE